MARYLTDVNNSFMLALNTKAKVQLLTRKETDQQIEFDECRQMERDVEGVWQIKGVPFGLLEIRYNSEQQET